MMVKKKFHGQNRRITAGLMVLAMLFTTVMGDTGIVYASQNARQLKSVFVEETDHVTVSVNDEEDTVSVSSGDEVSATEKDTSAEEIDELGNFLYIAVLSPPEP